MNMKLASEFEELYIDCFKKENIVINDRLKLKLIEENHVIIYSEEPNILGKYFLENQYNSKYSLEQRIVNVNLDGDNMDIEFYEAKPKNGKVGHIEFDFLMYQKNKIYYILDKVIEPVIQTGDIGKLLDDEQSKNKIIYLKNLDLILGSLSDDKVERKVLSWLEKYIHTTRFLLSFYTYSNNTTKKLMDYSFTLRVPRLLNKENMFDKQIEEWIKINMNQEVELKKLRNVGTFLGFRYYLRYVINNEYYGILYSFLEDIEKETQIKNKYLLIRSFLISWLQSGKKYRELLSELGYLVTQIKHTGLKIRLIDEIAKRSNGLENSKKIMYHLENVLSIFVE